MHMSLAGTPVQLSAGGCAFSFRDSKGSALHFLFPRDGLSFMIWEWLLLRAFLWFSREIKRTTYNFASPLKKTPPIYVLKPGTPNGDVFLRFPFKTSKQVVT